MSCAPQTEANSGFSTLNESKKMSQINPTALLISAAALVLALIVYAIVKGGRFFEVRCPNPDCRSSLTRFGRVRGVSRKHNVCKCYRCGRVNGMRVAAQAPVEKEKAPALVAEPVSLPQSFAPPPKVKDFAFAEVLVERSQEPPTDNIESEPA